MICQKYIHPIADCDTLPYIVFTQKNGWHREIHRLIRDIYCQMQEKGQCYEMAVQRALSGIFEYLLLNFGDLPKSETTRMQTNAQIRLQMMLSYIYEHYSETVRLEDIARAVHISRSEADRCFNKYMGCSPVNALIQYRLQIAHRLLRNGTLTIQEVSDSCGFHSVNYFGRQFRQIYGYTPSQAHALGK